MANASELSGSDGTGLIALDPWLESFRERLKGRHDHFLWMLSNLPSGNLLGSASLGHRYFGLNRGVSDGKAGVWYREWAPEALALSLVGDFNGWVRGANPLVRDEWGVWSTFLPDEIYADRLVHQSRVKVNVATSIGASDRIPAYIRRAVQDPATQAFSGQYWQPDRQYSWKHDSPSIDGGLRIYEAHVGMAQEEGKVGSFREFTEKTLPRIAEIGYNAIQLMAVMEHPYYGSFGYLVSNFFAVSSRFGTPEELKELIDAAHGLGLRVIMDIVHSHAVKNTEEGLNRFDGTDHQYFHAGGRGQHVAWDSMLFDYGKPEVLRFLLSNVRYWLEEFRFDGLRFDGVTSMIYLDHGLGHTFSTYDDYFGGNVDEDAVGYLKLANDLAHTLNPEAITIAEDVSGQAPAVRCPRVV